MWLFWSFIVISSMLACFQTQHPCFLIFFIGDFNHMFLSSILSTFHHFVTCNTKDNRILALLYTNVRDVCSSTTLPPLGRSDCILVLFTSAFSRSTYRKKLEVRLQGNRVRDVWRCLRKITGFQKKSEERICGGCDVTE